MFQNFFFICRLTSYLTAVAEEFFTRSRDLTSMYIHRVPKITREHRRLFPSVTLFSFLWNTKTAWHLTASVMHSQNSNGLEAQQKKRMKSRVLIPLVCFLNLDPLGIRNQGLMINLALCASSPLLMGAIELLGQTKTDLWVVGFINKISFSSVWRWCKVWSWLYRWWWFASRI